MKPDIQIAQEASIRPISEICEVAGIDLKYVEQYGRHKAKIRLELMDEVKDRAPGKLVFVTAMTPTPAGEGKTTTVVGLTQALGRLGHRSWCCLREPSLGPTFGVKGGAAGGGYSQVIPMEDINLHFTGDIHAVGTANNLLAAMIDNHIHAGNQLGIDPRQVVWRRVLDMNDRQLRQIVTGLGGKSNGILTETGFDITVASEIMAVLCLSANLQDLKTRLGRMIVAYTGAGQAVTAGALRAAGALTLLLKDAIMPNLVQTLEGQPAFVHGGPFANIAHGNNSIVATRMALQLGQYVVTEGGFGSDLGAEKFFDIVCPAAGFQPSAAVLVASVRALKYQGGVSRKNLSRPDLTALQAGLGNLGKHIGNLQLYGLPVIVAINRFPDDTDEELSLVRDYSLDRRARAAVSDVVVRGGEGGLALAGEVVAACGEPASFTPLFHGDESLEERLDAIVRKVYGGAGVDFSHEADRQLQRIQAMGFGTLPVCVAKTQASLSDDPALLGTPTGWRLQVRDLRLSAGAGFVVALCGNIMTLPGLPKNPAAEDVDISPDGHITGLF